MTKDKYESVAHDHDAFLERALRRKGFRERYDELEGEYLLARELLAARIGAGMTQEEVASSMGTTKSAVSRLEGAGKHSPSLSTLRRYAQAVGCEVEVRLVPPEELQKRAKVYAPVRAARSRRTVLS
jgi:DNA-binding XRE family transcriptional regulator